MKVLKFGGSSVQTAERIKNVIEIVKADPQAKVVVCSALGGVTDQLIGMGKTAAAYDDSYRTQFIELERKHLEAAKLLVDVRYQSGVLAKVKNMLNELDELLQGIYLLRELSKRTLDHVMSFGERLSCTLVAEAFKDQGLEASYLDTRAVVRTNARFGNAVVDFEATDRLIADWVGRAPGYVVATGFIGATDKGETTTLGRGGSDYTCSIFAAALQAAEAEIWTDVDGVMTADPRKVKQAFSIDSLSYEEAMEMSHFGAKVIYPPTMLPAMKKNIPIIIRNTFNPPFQGSVIGNVKSVTFANVPVKGISSIGNVSLLRLQGSGMVGESGVSARLFNALAQDQISVILITQASSEHTICVAVKPEEAGPAKAAVDREFANEIREGLIDPLVVEKDLSIVAIVGENMRNSSGVAGRMFQAMGNNGINVVAIAQGSSELNISTVIRREDETKALRALHQAFFLSDTKTIHAFIVGVGLVGNTLLRQMNEQRDYLRQEYNLEFRVAGLANSKKRLFDLNGGIDLDHWRDALQKDGAEMDMQGFIREMEQLNLANSVFVDNTASPEVAQAYEDILRNSISIVTPNKIASSSSYARYLSLRNTAKRHGVFMLYETNVGAALPVISTLRDLVNSGDKILRIEAVLSGTLSYIFNTFSAQTKFSEVVKDAKFKGYTEPDPREDLSCKDVGRKILILARECGYAMEFEHIEIQGFLPESCLAAPTVEEFFAELEKYDGYFEELRAKAEQAGQRLRCIAKFEGGKAQIALEAVGFEHSFYSLSGSDNIIAFTTARYPERPLVVKGSGAGAEVTAAGVFADMIRIANYF
jgi:bifunctional aspartokinase / homoserine dehydrogenase 1